jgi:hypothetical protein
VQTPRQILKSIIEKSGWSLRTFAEKSGAWDHSSLIRILSGKKAIGPAVVGRLLVHLDRKSAAELIRAYLNEQQQLIEAERKRFATGPQGKAPGARTGKTASKSGAVKRRGARGAAPK